MGNNPSHFKGPKNPVEQVSWDDCQQFLDKLNAKQQGPPGGQVRSCRRRPSGNMPAGRGARRGIALGTMSRSWANMRGTIRTRTTRRILLARRSRTPGGCTTCTGTYGSGVRIGMMMVIMRSRRRTIRRGLPRARTACFAAVAGAPGGALPVGGPRRLEPGVRDNAWASVSPEFRRTSEVSERSRCAARSVGPKGAGRSRASTGGVSERQAKVFPGSRA